MRKVSMFLAVLIVMLCISVAFAIETPYQLREWKDYKYEVKVWFNSAKSYWFTGQIVKFEGDWILLENSKYLCWVYIPNVVGLEIRK